MTYPSSTQICRANDWTVGDILEGQDEIGLDRIRITAIGEQHALVRWQYADWPESSERIISLDFRDWRKAEVVK